MKKLIIIIFLAASFLVTLSACNNTTTKNPANESKSTESIVYTCTMHPEVQSDKPGDCPKCGMELVKMEAGDKTHVHNQSDTTQMMD